MQKFLPVLLVLLLATEFILVSTRGTKTKKPKHETTTPAINATTEEIENDPAPKKCNKCHNYCECGYYQCKGCWCNECDSW
ncbi:unnamed protein product [Meloidogyne enterolobii]|uniref:Uncharacterized protein n=2 Tax=Meloidogyne enterolobii TaxID=390850 RepID=A0ACB0Y9T5_MELEN|nr:unnamed protein product [Meloidogyne enterolobii]